MALTTEEQERLAYIKGDIAKAKLLQEKSDLQKQLESLQKRIPYRPSDEGNSCD